MRTNVRFFKYMTNPQFYSLKVSSIKPLTQEAVQVTFDIPEALEQVFDFIPGQYLTLMHDINGEQLRRSYSISSAPSEKLLSVGVKQVPKGKFSTFVNRDLKVGDTLDVMPPKGNFIIKNPNISHVVCYAAGSGITPIISQIKHLLFTSNVQITLIYSNKNFGSTMYREELESLKNKYIGRLAIHHVFTKEKLGIPILYGRIDSQKCKDMSRLLYDTESIDYFLLCGPNEMIFDIKSTLENLNVPSEKILFELFNTDSIKKVFSEDENVKFKASMSEVVIQMDGDLFEFDCAYLGESLLDEAINVGADLPYSCKGGVCSTCKAKVLEGDVVMAINYSLEPEEIESGYVLMCQAHPRSEKVFIDFDQK